MPYLVDFLLYGELAESRERQREEQADSPIKDGEGVTKCALYLFRRAHNGSGIRHSPVGPGLQQMTVVVEFDSYADALAAYETEDYKKALAALGSGVERDFRIAEGA